MLDIDDLNETLYLRYLNLREDLSLQKKGLVSGSVFCTLLGLSSGDRFTFLVNSSLDVTHPNEFSKYKDAESESVLQRINQEQKISMIFTAKGILDIEREKGYLDDTKLLTFIQKKYFSFTHARKNLNSKEKSVLFSLITMHCFGIENAMDLEGSTKQAIWFELINEKIFPYLQTLSIVPKIESLLPLNTGNESPATYLMRRQNDLSIKTYGIFSNPGNSKYFLGLSLEDSSAAKNWIFNLFNLILPENVSFETLKAIKEFIVLTNHEFVSSIHGKIDAEDEKWSLIIDDALDAILLK